MVVTFTDANRLWFGDTDAGFNPVAVTITSSAGTLNFTRTIEVTTAGQGTGNVTLSGRADYINWLLQDLTYTGNAGTILVQINDQGNVGTGGMKIATMTFTIAPLILEPV